jgi:prefoldin subunit 5
MEDNEREKLIEQIENLNNEIDRLTEAQNALEEDNKELIRVLQQVDSLIWEARNLTKHY